MVCIPCIYKLRRCSGNIIQQLEAMEYALEAIGSETPAFTTQECADFKHTMEVIEASVESLSETLQAKLEQTEENQD